VLQQRVDRPLSQRTGYALAIFGALLWGFIGIAGAEIERLTHMLSAETSTWRLLIGGCALVAVGVGTGELRGWSSVRGSLRQIALTSVSAAVSAISFLEAVARIGVATSTVVFMGMCPLFGVLISSWRNRGLPSASVLSGALLAVVGLALVCGSQTLVASDHQRGLAGFGFGVLAGLAFVTTTLVNQRASGQLGPISVVGLSFCGAGLLTSTLIPFQSHPPAHWSAPAVGWLLFMAAVPTALGHVAFFAGLQRGVSATAGLVITTFELVSASVMAVIMLGESLRPAAIAGICVIFVSVVVAREAEDQDLEVPHT
jgi:drug/metabolite transporter (DMT)-like permease